MLEDSIETTHSIQLPDPIDSVVNGREVIFTENKLPVAKLIAVPHEKPQPLFGSAKGFFVMADDFNESFEDFTNIKNETSAGYSLDVVVHSRILTK